MQRKILNKQLHYDVWWKLYSQITQQLEARLVTELQYKLDTFQVKRTGIWAILEEHICGRLEDRQ